MSIDKEKQELLEIAQEALMEEGFEIYIYDNKQDNEPDFFVKTYNKDLEGEYMIPVFVESSESLRKQETIKKILDTAKECDFQGQSCMVVLHEKDKSFLEDILKKEGLSQVVDIIDIPEE